MSSPCAAPCSGEIAGLGRLSAAMGLDAATNNFTRMVGPTAGWHVLLITLGLAGAYALGVLLYCVAFMSMASLSFQERSTRGQLDPVGVLTSISEGFAYIRTNRLIAGTLVITVFVNLFGFSYVSMVPVIGEQRLGLGARWQSACSCRWRVAARCWDPYGSRRWARSRYFTAIYMFGLYAVSVDDSGLLAIALVQRPPSYASIRRRLRYRLLRVHAEHA